MPRRRGPYRQDIRSARPVSRRRSATSAYVHPSHSFVMQLQRSAGNAAVTSLFEGKITSERFFEATIARMPRGASPKSDSDRAIRGTPGHSGDLDAEEGREAGEVNSDAVTAALAGSLPVPAEGAPEETVTLPNMTTPESVAAVDTDKVKPSLDFKATVANSGVTTPFGATTWANFNLTDIKVTKKKDSYSVSFKVDNPITYAVDSPKTSIASATDPALTKTNYPTAADDLMPRKDVQNGKPKRTQFWARDLTLKHELFHSKERCRLNKAGAKQAEKWLGKQAAASVAEVQNLVAQVPAKIIDSSQAAVGTLDEKESRAYGDGASSYKSRAKAIKKRGDQGKYP